MKLQALDTLHISNVRPEPLRAGEEFEVNEGEGQQLVKRGLAKEVKSSAKSEDAPANKAEAVPANKQETSRRGKS